MGYFGLFCLQCPWIARSDALIFSAAGVSACLNYAKLALTLQGSFSFAEYYFSVIADKDFGLKFIHVCS